MMIAAKETAQQIDAKRIKRAELLKTSEDRVSSYLNNSSPLEILITFKQLRIMLPNQASNSHELERAIDKALDKTVA